jgi:hypothetical protein
MGGAHKYFRFYPLRGLVAGYSTRKTRSLVEFGVEAIL